VRIALVAALGLAAPAAATAWSRPSVDPPTVSCNKVILRIGTPAATANGYRLILGSVSVLPAFQQQVVRTGERPWTHYRKAGLVVRGNSLPVYVTVPKAWRGRASRAARRSTRERGGDFAGPPQLRADDLQSMFADPEIAAIQTMREGYGTVELSLLDGHDIAFGQPL
jgi:LD-carboxypeptidase N-terminal domain